MTTLQTLPPELRIQIYKHVFHDCMLVFNAETKTLSTPSILHTCRQLRAEAGPLLPPALSLMVHRPQANRDVELTQQLPGGVDLAERVVEVVTQRNTYRVAVDLSLFPALQTIRVLFGTMTCSNAAISAPDEQGYDAVVSAAQVEAWCRSVMLGCRMFRLRAKGRDAWESADEGGEGWLRLLVEVEVVFGFELGVGIGKKLNLVYDVLAAKVVMQEWHLRGLGRSPS